MKLTQTNLQIYVVLGILDTTDLSMAAGLSEIACCSWGYSKNLIISQDTFFVGITHITVIQNDKKSLWLC